MDASFATGIHAIDSDAPTQGAPREDFDRDIDELIQQAAGEDTGWRPKGENPLDRSHALDVAAWSDAPEIEAATEAITEELKALDGYAKANRRILATNLRVVLMNLWRVAVVSREHHVTYARGNTAYGDPKRYNPLKIKPRPLKKAIDGLEALGYTESTNGFFDRRYEIGRLSRVRATDSLINRLRDEFGFTNDLVPDRGRSEPIRLRGNSRKLLDYEETPDIIAMRERLRAYNALLAGAAIKLSPEGMGRACALEEDIDFARNWAYRIFSRGSFDLGGRFYGPWWQQVKSELRRHILINNQPTVECDYSAMHIHLLYSVEGIDYREMFGDEDPYALGNNNGDRRRNIRKSVVLIALNARDRGSAIRASRKWLRDEVQGDVGPVNMERVIDQFTEKHDLIKHHLGSDIGIKLQNIDAGITDHVLTRMTDMGIIALGIHDSFIVEEEHGELLKDLMVGAFEERGLVSIPEIKVRKLEQE